MVVVVASTAAVGAVPDSKVHGANMGPIWGRQDPGGPHVGPMKFAIWGEMIFATYSASTGPVMHGHHLFICDNYSTG